MVSAEPLSLPTGSCYLFLPIRRALGRLPSVTMAGKGLKPPKKLIECIAGAVRRMRAPSSVVLERSFTDAAAKRPKLRNGALAGPREALL